MPPKPAPTHFLCIPLVTPVSRPQLNQSLASFSADVTSPLSFGVPEDAVRPVGTLHLTLGVFSFPRSDGLERAKELLRTLKPREILAAVKPPVMLGTKESSSANGVAGTSDRLTITLRGLESMQAAAKAAVLYAPPSDQLGTLYAFCERLRGAFQKAELMEEETRPLLLHATIVNTIYVKGGRDKKKGGRRAERLTIDARGILDRYEDQIWMQDVPVEKIAICKMGAKKMVVGDVEEEAYEVVEEIDV
ncbi:hypothetical protein GQ53DRAFT_749184 [Thozetella sp. PMI_491]|nr:hypothetical protein GQ53DRAFT_749184 [Thozetella sp. PMI_491]